MKTRLIRGLNSKALTDQPRIIALGNFDGLHAGHRILLADLCKQAKKSAGMRSCVVSFYPHPALVLGKTKKRPPLMCLRQRLAVLSAFGIDELILLRFSHSFSQISAADFVNKILLKRLNLKSLCVGPDVAFGKGREAGVNEVQQLIRAGGAELLLVDHLMNAGEKIGTRSIRKNLEVGDLEAANLALGAPYVLSGRVIRGDGRGKGISIPTANLATKQLLPSNGVYVGMLTLGSEKHPAVINIGERPTFNGLRLSVEAHLYQYQGPDFYRQRITIELYQRLRNEQRFASITELVQQIRSDISDARQYFETGTK